MKWKLQELCLRRIIEQFEIYTPFYESEDGKLKLSFEFLLRKYSAEIISELYDRKQLKPMYANILVNRYLTSINTDWFQTNRWEIISAKLAAIGFTLKELHVHENTGGWPWKGVFCYLPNLKIIWFNENGCSDEVLERVAEFCPNVVEIYAGSASNVTLRGIKHLGLKENGTISCPNLKRLCIYGADIFGEDTPRILKIFPYLEDIIFWDLPFFLFKRHRRDVLKARKTVLYNLTSLWIPDICELFPPSRYNNFLKVCVSVCPYLKELDCPFYSEEHADTVSNLKHLAKLEVECMFYFQMTLNGLFKCIGSTLKSLRQEGSRFSVDVLAESCPLLEELNTRYVYFDIDNESSVIVFHHLSSCSFHVIPGESIQQACALISASHRLTNVTFSCCTFPSEMKTELVKSFSHCPLKKIDFYRSPIGFDFAVKILRNCPDLSVLKLRESFGMNPELRRDLSAIASTLPWKPFVLFVDSS